MAAKAVKPYEQFGSWILFKKLETDALSDLWRAAKIENDLLGAYVALRRLTGGDRTALVQSATEARGIVPLLNGSSFVKHQVIDIQDAVPFIAHEYAGGRSLRHIVDRARGGAGIPPLPIPLDQAVAIAERVALSLSTTAELRYGGNRLLHGAILPQFIWITDDGEVRTAGQHLGKGIVASLSDSKVNAEIGRYFSPEYHSTRESTKSSEVYAMGAILFLLVTGAEPPDPLSVTAFGQIVRAAKTMSGQPIPLEIRTILDKSLILDPAGRFPSIAEMKQALDLLAAKYSATSFNLAFYLSTLLKKELEAEVLEREKESKVSLQPYVAPELAATSTPTGPIPRVTAAVSTSPRSKMPMLVAAGIVGMALLAGGAFVLMRGSPQPAVSSVQGAASTPPPKPGPLLSQPVLAASTTPANSTAATTGTLDPTAQKKAFEDAVNQKLQSEMLKLQGDFNKQLQQKKSKEAPIVTETVAQARPAPPEERAPSAAALDERRLTTRQPAPTTTQPSAAVASPQPESVTPQPAEPQPAPAPAPAVTTRVINEGDVVDLTDLDTVPKMTRQPYVQYPPMAMKQRAETSIIVSALVSERGDVIDVHVLRGDNRFGFNDAATRALRTAKFTPGLKDGKRVKVWVPQTVNFKL